MGKKMLIFGSSIAVVVLVLASLSPVVGYNTAKTSVKGSPLFCVRTSRANQEESEDLICDYIKKDVPINIPLPERVNNVELAKKIINRIKMMDDKTFDRFINSIIKYQQINNAIHEENIEEIMPILYQLKDNPDEAMKYIFHGDESTKSDCNNAGFNYCPREFWIILEFVIFLHLIVLLLTLFIPIFLYYIWVTAALECYP